MEKKILKFNKIILIIITVIMFINVFCTNAFAAILNPNTYKPGDIGASGNTLKIVSNIVTTFQVVGIIITICSIGLLGIKYMTGSLEQRAEYKKTLLPFIIGVALITAITTIVRIIYTFVSKNIT